MHNNYDFQCSLFMTHLSTRSLKIRNFNAMNSNRFISIFIIFLSSLVSLSAFCQQTESADSLEIFNSIHIKTKPRLHYSAGSSFTYILRYGSISGLNISSFLSYPVSPKISVEAGLIAGRYYSTLKNIFPESGINNSFNTLSVYGSASYQLNQRLTFYGTGIRQLAGSLPLYNLPAGSLTFGSTLTFGNFSVGAAIQMSDWNNYYSSSPFGGNHNYFPSYPW